MVGVLRKGTPMSKLNEAEREKLANWVHTAIAQNYANDENGLKGTKIQVRYESLHRTIMDLILSLLPPDHPMNGLDGN